MKTVVTAGGDALQIRPFPDGYSAEPIRNLVKQGDVCLSNLECVISEYDKCGSAYSGGTWVCTRPCVLDEFLQFGFNLFSLANNHSMDYSYGGLLSSIEEMEKRNLKFAGIGRDLQEANRAAVLETTGGKIALISVSSSFTDAARAGYTTPYLPGRPGLNPLRFSESYTVSKEHLEALREVRGATKMFAAEEKRIRDGFSQPEKEGSLRFGSMSFSVGEAEGRHSVCHKGDKERILSEIRRAKTEEGCDRVFVMFHSHQIDGALPTTPDQFAVEFCHAAIDAGADGIFGGGTHQLKPIELYNGKPIFYSLGDFCFQNNLVEVLPADFMEKFGLSPDSTAEEGLFARSRGGKVGLDHDKNNYLTVIPRVTYEDEALSEIILYPISLGFEKEGAAKGIPYLADSADTEEIFSVLKEISAPYGTSLSLEGGTIKVRLS